MKSKPILFLFAFSFIISLATGFYAAKVSSEYYTVNDYAPDPMDGLIRNQHAYYNFVNNGRISAFVSEFKENNRTFFTTASLILIAPEFLKRADGHLLLLIPFLTLFLFLLSYCVWIRTNNILYSITVVVLYVTSYAITEPYFGIGFSMPDTIAGYPAGIAALCLLIWFEKNKTRWLLLCAIFISISVLTRFVFTVYTFLLFSVPLILIFNHQYKILLFKWKDILKVMLLFGGVILLLCGFYLYNHYKFNNEYYSYWLNAGKKTMNSTLFESLEGFTFMFTGFLRKIHAIFLSMLVISSFYFFHINKENLKQRLLLIAWMFFILPFYWIVILRTNGHVVSSVFLAAFPIMFLCIVYPLNTLIIEKRKKAFNLLLVIIIISGFVDFIISVQKNSDSNQNVNTVTQIRKSTTIVIADMLNTIIPRDSIISLYVFSCGYLGEEISLESFYSAGRLIKTNPSENMFYLYTNFCTCNSNNSEDEIIDSIYQKTNQTNNVLLFFTEGHSPFPNDSNSIVLKNAERSLYNIFSSDTLWKSTPVSVTSLGDVTLFYRNYLSLPENHKGF
ncbi:MAG: hypothetical protein ABI840_10525 [bacterium]